MELDIQKSILIDISANSQEEVFTLISCEAIDRGYAENSNLLLEALNNRENEGTTGMMDGFAIPHAKSNTIKIPALVILKLITGVEWNSMDGKKIDFVISLLIPEEEKSNTHLKLLSKVAKLLMNEEVKNLLREAKNDLEIDSILTKYTIR